MRNFLYIFEDGSVQLGPKPSNDEIEAVESGELVNLIDLKKKLQYIPGQGWDEIETIELDVDEEELEEDYDD